MTTSIPQDVIGAPGGPGLAVVQPYKIIIKGEDGSDDLVIQSQAETGCNLGS